MNREPWDDWVKTCGQPTVWCGFDWPEIVETYVVLPQGPQAMTRERQAEFERDCLKWRGRLLTGRHAHWCYDWDGLPVDETTPEWPCACAQDPKP